MTPRIDERILNKLRTLSDSELNQLKENVLQDGILHPLVVWKETGILLDGHHRLAIAEEYGLDYKVVEVSLPDWDAALQWVNDFQAGRRNWTKEERNEWMRSKRAEGWTYQKIAERAGVSYGTVHNVASDVELINSDKLPGRDGKALPARYQRRRPEPEPEPEAWEDPSEPEPEQVVDRRAQRVEVVTARQAHVLDRLGPLLYNGLTKRTGLATR